MAGTAALVAETAAVVAGTAAVVAETAAVMAGTAGVVTELPGTASAVTAGDVVAVADTADVKAGTADGVTGTADAVTGTADEVADHEVAGTAADVTAEEGAGDAVAVADTADAGTADAVTGTADAVDSRVESLALRPTAAPAQPGTPRLRAGTPGHAEMQEERSMTSPRGGKTLRKRDPAHEGWWRPLQASGGNCEASDREGRCVDLALKRGENDGILLCDNAISNIQCHAQMNTIYWSTTNSAKNYKKNTTDIYMYIQGAFSS